MSSLSNHFLCPLRLLLISNGPVTVILLEWVIGLWFHMHEIMSCPLSALPHSGAPWVGLAVRVLAQRGKAFPVRMWGPQGASGAYTVSASSRGSAAPRGWGWWRARGQWWSWRTAGGEQRDQCHSSHLTCPWSWWTHGAMGDTHTDRHTHKEKMHHSQLFRISISTKYGYQVRQYPYDLLKARKYWLQLVGLSNNRCKNTAISTWKYNT